MRGLFYYRIYADDPPNRGVTDKCRQFASAFEAYGISADTVFFSEKGLTLNDKLIRQPDFEAPKGSLRHALFFFLYADALLWRSVDWSAYDFMAIRHLPAHPGFISLLRKIKRAHPRLRILLDLPTWPYDLEAASWKDKWINRIDRLYRARMRPYVDAVLHSGPEQDILGIPVIRTSNGVDVESYTSERLSPNDQRGLQLIFAGNISSWHGLDRVLKGLALYQTAADALTVCLSIVGQGREEGRLRELVSLYGLQSCVRFVPPQTTPQLNALYAQAHMAVGALAMHRKAMTYSVSLKHRSYCAAGLPFIYAGEDPDFKAFPYALQLPGDDSPLNVGHALAFYRRLQRERPEYRREISGYAAKHLSWEAKIAPIAQYLMEKTNAPHDKHTEHLLQIARDKSI